MAPRTIKITPESNEYFANNALLRAFPPSCIACELDDCSYSLSITQLKAPIVLEKA